MNEDLKDLLDRLLRAFTELYGPRLRKVILFGSQARGDAQPDSDVDLLIILEGPVHPGTEIARTGPILAELSLDTGLVPSCVFMDEERFVKGEGPLLRNIRREGVVV